jgi:hypothetical protein
MTTATQPQAPAKPGIRAKCSNPSCMARLVDRPLRCPRCRSTLLIYCEER